MYRALPGADYYEGSVPSRRHQRTPRLACPEGRRRGREGSHVHCRSIGGLVPSYAPAGLPRRSRSHSSRSLGGRIHAAEDRSPRNPQGARAPHGRPVSIGFEPATSLAGVLPLVHMRYTAPPCLPRPRDPKVLARRVVVRAAPALPRSSGVRLPSASPDRCDGLAVGSRTPLDPTAPRGARTRPDTPGCARASHRPGGCRAASASPAPRSDAPRAAARAPSRSRL